MYVPYQTLAVMLLVGLVAGWIAAKVVTKHGMGIAGDVIVGVIAAFIEDWLLPRLGIQFGDRTRAYRFQRYDRSHRLARSGSCGSSRLK
jgi:uncharacterized membrane protein YeaQ/YmgE (transglycosylase-associated protein family)